MEHLPTVTSATAQKLTAVLADFKVYGEITSVHAGPTVTIFEFEPQRGIKTAKIIGLAVDVARYMAVKSVRMSCIGNSSAIAIELPNTVREVVSLTALLQTTNWQQSKANLPIALGKNMQGDAVIVDLAKMPHLLVAGQTGSGKSVGIHTIICSLLSRFSSDELRLVLIDPKMLEMSQYNKIPHLLAPVITDATKAVAALNWAISEMQRRYRLMQQLNVRDITQFNRTAQEYQLNEHVITETVQVGFYDDGEPEYAIQDVQLDQLPYIVIIVDEVASLMLQAGKAIELATQQISQMARAAGIHIIMATQRPSVDVITGTIKANLPARISFQVQSKIDSTTIIGQQGAEQLLGNGDMLLLEGSNVVRIQGAFIDDDGIADIIDTCSFGFTPCSNDIITTEAA